MPLSFRYKLFRVLICKLQHREGECVIKLYEESLNEEVNEKNKGLIENEAKFLIYLGIVNVPAVTYVHHGLGKLYDKGYYKGNAYYIITQNLAYGNLVELTERKKGDLVEIERFSIPTVRYIFTEIVKSMIQMHTQGIPHLDLKLENLILDNFGKVIIIDFGLCQIPDNGDMPIKRIGTTDYGPPELDGKTKPNYVNAFSADIFCLGSILFKLAYKYLFYPFKIFYNDFKNYEYKSPWEMILDIDMRDDNFDADRHSADLRNLLQSLLAANPIGRPSLAEIMAHPWLNQKLPPMQYVIAEIVAKRKIYEEENKFIFP